MDSLDIKGWQYLTHDGDTYYYMNCKGKILEIKEFDVEDGKEHFNGMKKFLFDFVGVYKSIQDNYEYWKAFKEALDDDEEGDKDE